MIIVNKAEEREKVEQSWLEHYHIFPFTDNSDPRFAGLRKLRVLNEDFVIPGGGFPTHPHQNMEIISYVLDGQLEHKDSLGNGSIIRPGDVQRMSAGTGITHSEYNPSLKGQVHFLQIWILPRANGLKPGYGQANFSDDEKYGKFRLVASPDGSNGSITINQDLNLYAATLDNGQKIGYKFEHGHNGWLHVAKGTLLVNDRAVKAGDGIALLGEENIEVVGRGESEILLFDL
jgi:redox-sensitive bicupin YhaK (pirin superfamily)